MIRKPFAARAPLTALAMLLIALGASAAQSHDGAAARGNEPAAVAASRVANALRLQASPDPLAVLYAVAISRGGAAKSQPIRRANWYFIRDARQITLLRGAIDEAWHRDEQGRVRFERVFHDEQRAVDYSAGELATLDVRVDWAALSTFVDPRELLALKLISVRGRGVDERIQLRGAAGADTLDVEWLPALQVPAKLTRTAADGTVTRFELQRQFAAAPAGWPVPGARSENYLRLDAADFGDMDYDPVVKKSEALDIRLGWRSAHKHD